MINIIGILRSPFLTDAVRGAFAYRETHSCALVQRGCHRFTSF